MKKCVSMLVVIMLIVSILTFASAEIIEAPELGIKLDIPEDLSERGVALLKVEDENYFGLAVYYLNMQELAPYEEAAIAAMNGADEEAGEAALNAYADAVDRCSAPYCMIVAVETDRLEGLKEEIGIDENSVLIGANSTHTYYNVPASEPEKMDDEHRTLMEENRSAADAVIESIEIIEITVPAGDDIGEAAGDFSSFSTVDMDGNIVTQDIFAQADLTVLNVWGTFCGPCIREMPELAAWDAELPEDVQIVGLVIDVYSDSDSTFGTAQKIISKSGVAYTNILMSESLQMPTSGITGVPTTLFFDRNGNQICEPIVGAYVERYKDIVNEFLGK